MTHEELLKKIEILIADFCEGEYCPTCAPYKALRAVVEEHKPIEKVWTDNSTDIYCESCGDALWIPYPCRTIVAIEKELK
jgi:hypothetical protein